MSDLIEYFVRHYTLVLDNDYDWYRRVAQTARDVVVNENVTMAEFRTMSTAERNDAYASTIGESVLDMVDEIVDLAVDERVSPFAAMLIREIMITSDSDLAYALGKHYMPEEGDLDGWLDEDNDEYEGH